MAHVGEGGKMAGLEVAMELARTMSIRTAPGVVHIARAILGVMAATEERGMAA